MNSARQQETGAPDGRPVLVLGGGINGAAVARELLLNEISVVLVDQADLAWGATAASSRLIHGGLRYLEHADFSLVRQSLAERTRLLQLAPQFVQPLRLYIPIAHRLGGGLGSAANFFGVRRLAARLAPRDRGLWVIRAGLLLYDILARRSWLPRHAVHRVGHADVPPVDPNRYRWLCSYYDAQMLYPERFVVALLRDARQLAADRQLTFRVLPYHQVTRLGRRVRLTSRARPPHGPDQAPADRPTMELEPAMVINATGAWVDQTLQQLDVPAPRLMGGTKGSHIFTRHAGLRAALGQRAIYAEATDGRPVFLLPLGPFAMVGTTDLPVQGDPQQAATEPEEVQYLLGTIRQVFPQLQLTHRDVQLHCCGVRPLPSSQSSDPGSVTRRHLLKQHEADGLAVLSLIGGKLTTCRQVAEEVATIVCQHLDRPCKQNSRNRLIPGAEGYADGPDAVRRAQEQLSSHGGWTADQVQAAWQLGGSLAAHLLGRHPGPPGTASQANIAGTELAEPLVRHVIRHEWCTHLSDVVCRRLLLPYRTGIAAATLRQVARLMQQEGRLPAEQIHWQQQACRQELRERHGIEVEV